MESPEFSALRPQSTEPTVESLQGDLRSLRGLFQVALAALILLAGSVNLVLWRQVSLQRKEALRMQQIVEDYQKNNEPVIEGLVLKLQAFTKSNPDFAAILSKYSLNPEAAPISAAPGAVKK